MKLHNIKIVQKGPKNKIMTGANTKVLIDGKAEGFDLRLKVSLARFERATSCLEGSCSIQLSYRDQSSTHNLTSREYKVKVIIDS